MIDVVCGFRLPACFVNVKRLHWDKPQKLPKSQICGLFSLLNAQKYGILRILKPKNINFIFLLKTCSLPQAFGCQILPIL